MSDMKEHMAALQQLNLAIVAARKRGEHDEVARLKVRVERFLAGALSVSLDVAAPSSPSLSAPQAPSSARPALVVQPLSVEVTLAKAPASASTAASAAEPVSSNSLDTYDMMAIMRELNTVNCQIVEARKAGNEMQVKRLQKRAESLMKMGSQSLGSQ